MSRVEGLLIQLIEEQRKPKKNYVVYEDILEKDDEAAFTSAKSGL